jgi:hypothetical protein
MGCAKDMSISSDIGLRMKGLTRCCLRGRWGWLKGWGCRRGLGCGREAGEFAVWGIDGTGLSRRMSAERRDSHATAARDPKVQRITRTHLLAVSVKINGTQINRR